MDNKKEYILCAAIKRVEARDCRPYYPGQNDICGIEIGYRHHDIYQRFNDRSLSKKLDDQGFYTSKGRFVDRKEAMNIAVECGQVDERLKGRDLFSEDLY